MIRRTAIIAGFISCGKNLINIKRKIFIKPYIKIKYLNTFGILFFNKNKGNKNGNAQTRFRFNVVTPWSVKNQSKNKTQPAKPKIVKNNLSNIKDEFDFLY